MKKRYFVICILINLLALGLIPLNLYLIAIPEWITLILDILAAGALAAFFLWGRGKMILKIILSILLILTIGISLFGTYCNPYWSSSKFRGYSYSKSYDTELTYAQAKADLDYAMHYIEKDHPLFMEGVPAEVQQRYDKALEELQNAETIDVRMVYQKLQNICSVLGDGHTCSYPNLSYMEEHYLKYIQQRKDAGDTLVAVNDMELAKILEEKSDLYCYEVESWGLRQLKSDLSTLEGLRFLSIPVNEGIAYTYEDLEGNRNTEIYDESDFVTYEEYMELNQIESQTETSAEESFVYYAIDSERSLAFLTLNACNYNEEYCQCLQDMFTEVKEQGIEHVAVDIRENGGGNSLVANEFIRYLDVDTYRTETGTWRLGIFNLDLGTGINTNSQYTDLTFRGDVYVLTSAGSFSAAMMFAEYIKDNQLGTIIGEAPGNTPSGYGDIAIFRLPNSGLYVQVSTKEFFRADQETDDSLVSPDIECEASEAVEVLYEKIK